MTASINFLCSKTAKIFLPVLTAAFVFAYLPNVALAQSVDDLNRAAREGERIQREQQLQQQRDRDTVEGERQRIQLDTPAVPAAPTSADTGCKNITDITLAGVKLMPTDDRVALITPYAGTCMSVSDIQKLLTDVTAWYVKAGYISARAYLPNQDLNSGQLQILVVEGRVEGLELDDGQENSLNLALLFPGVIGAPLNLRDIEMGLEQAARLQSNQPTMEIKPGTEAGDSVVVIKNQPSFPLHFSLTADNQGSQSTGRTQWGATVSSDNIIGLNEFASATRRQSRPFGETGKRSSSENYVFIVPYGYTTMTVSYSNSRYDSFTDTSGGFRLVTAGDSRNKAVKFDHVAYRSQSDRLSLSGGLTLKDTNSYAGGQLLSVASRNLSVLDVGVDYSTVVWGGAISGNFGVSRGLKIFDAQEDVSGIPDDSPHAQFTLFKIGGNYNKPFEAFAQKLSWNSALTAQYSLHGLYGSEQISIGGIYSVRGFYNESIAADDGFYLRNDLSTQIPVGAFAGYETRLKPYLGLDVGYVRPKIEGNSGGTLAGAAVGATLTAGPFNLDGFLSRAIVHRSSIENEGVLGFWRATLSF